LRSIAICVALVSLSLVTGCGVLPGSGINTVPWPGTQVSHAAQPVQLASDARVVQRQRRASVHARHGPGSVRAGRAEAETSPAMEVAAPASPTTKPSPEIASADPHAESLKRLLEWHAQSAKQQAQDEQQDRDLAKTISGICHGC
jgi:hypothetical protein